VKQRRRELLAGADALGGRAQTGADATGKPRLCAHLIEVAKGPPTEWGGERLWGTKYWKARNILALFGENALIGTTMYDALDR